jgi:hypothetical protein
MRCDELTERVCDRLTGDSAPAAAAELRAHLDACPACAAEAAALESLWRDLDPAAPAPSARLRARFDAMLAREIGRSDGAAAGAAQDAAVVRHPAARRSMPPGLPAAIAASLVVALGAGVWVGSSMAARRGARDVAELRHEVRSLRSTVALALLAEPSASERLSGVAAGRELQLEDDRVAEALHTVFLDDPNVNVRLAALDALRERAAEPGVRARLLEAIPAQDSPLVQLSAIDVVLEHGGDAERGAVERLARRPGLDAVVRGYLLDRLGRIP